MGKFLCKDYCYTSVTVLRNQCSGMLVEHGIFGVGTLMIMFLSYVAL